MTSKDVVKALSDYMDAFMNYKLDGRPDNCEAMLLKANEVEYKAHVLSSVLNAFVESSMEAKVLDERSGGTW